ncbi:MAG: zinc-dependent alcohol dehydrogenase family protein [Terriglobales bacterium]
MERMRALLLDSPRPADSAPLRLTDLPAPEPGHGEVRIRIRCCAVCRTDLHIVEGDLPLPRLPIVPGHQIVGFVDALGGGVHTLKAGDRVGIPWLCSTDGTCSYCQGQNENLCEQARFTGYHVDGGYAEYCIVREGFAHPIPAVFSDEHAAPLLCAGVIGFRAYRLSGAGKGYRLGLYGFGSSAHLVLQLARYQGCDVYVFTRGRAHRELAEQLGAVWTGAAEDTPPHPLDASIIFAPAGALVPQALRVIRKAGTLALAGITMSQIPALDYGLLYHERVVRSVANSTREDCRDFLRVAAEIPIRPRIQIYPLADANRALQDLKHSRLEGAGVLQLQQ